jgi:hypothetical protein
MILNRYKLPIIITRTISIIAKQTTKLWKTPKLSLPRMNRGFLVAAGMTLSLGCAYAIEDEAIRSLKSLMAR